MQKESVGLEHLAQVQTLMNVQDQQIFGILPSIRHFRSSSPSPQGVSSTMFTCQGNKHPLLRYSVTSFYS